MDTFCSLVPPPSPHSLGDGLCFPLSACCPPSWRLPSCARCAVGTPSLGLSVGNPSSQDSEESYHEHQAQESFSLLSLMLLFSLVLLIFFTQSGKAIAESALDLRPMWDLNSGPNARGKTVTGHPEPTFLQHRHLKRFL